MNKWQALVQIVKSFNERGSTLLAFLAVCAFVVVPILVGALITLAFGHVPAMIGQVVALAH